MGQFDQKINDSAMELLFTAKGYAYIKKSTPISPYYTVSTEAVSTAFVA